MTLGKKGGGQMPPVLPPGYAPGVYMYIYAYKSRWGGVSIRLNIDIQNEYLYDILNQHNLHPF